MSDESTNRFSFVIKLQFDVLPLKMKANKNHRELMEIFDNTKKPKLQNGTSCHYEGI